MDEHQELLYLLRENLEMARDNNRLLRQARRIGRVAFWFKVAVWIVILGLPILAYSFFAPIIQKSGFDGLKLFGYPSSDDIQSAIHNYKSGSTTP
jgi:hypothetical protein